MRFTFLSAPLVSIVLTVGCLDGASPEQVEASAQSATVSSGLISPEQDLSDFPPWIWPYIHPVDVMANVITGRELEFEKAAELMALSVAKQCECNTVGAYSFDQLLGMMNATFDAQYAALSFAQLKAAGLEGKSINYWDDDDWCGTPPKPWPWPWPILDLVQFEAERFLKEFQANFDLDDKQVSVLERNLKSQLERFAVFDAQR